MPTSTSSYILEGDAYFHPQLQLEASSKKSQIDQLLSQLRLSKQNVEELRRLLRLELDYGLLASPPRPSAYPMYNTFATKFPNGTEVGDYLGMDIGGTNLRLVHLKLSKKDDGKYEKEIDMKFYDVPDDVRKSNSEKFFGFLATSVADYVTHRNLASLGTDIPFGFTFSFGYDQHSINSGTTVQFGINTNIPDAVGKDPVQQLQAALNERKVPVKIVALANDATATLTYGKYLDKDTVAGLILGSGTNVAYIEQVSKFEPIADPVKTFGEKVDQFVVNTEYCVYGDKGELDQFMSKYDQLVDAGSYHPKVYVYEKLMGGAFLGESFRHILVDLIQNGLLLNGKVTEALSQKNAITTADISTIEAEFESNGSNARSNKSVDQLLSRFGYSEISDDDRAIVTFAGQLVTTRAALFTAAAVSVFVDHLNELEVVKFGCDGSLFRKHPKMSKLINSYVTELCPRRKAEVFNAEQGSSIGVAMMAAVVCSQ